MSSIAGPSNSENEYRAIVKSCLKQMVRVTLTDGRIIDGVLDCYDDHGNLVLSDATDVTRKGAGRKSRTVRLGMVLVPGNGTARVEVWTKAYEEPQDIPASMDIQE